MGTLTDHLASEFNVAELVLIAEYLRLAPVSDWGARRCIDAVLRKVRTDGVPTLPPEVEGEPVEVALTRDFLYVSELIDEAGNLIDAPESKGGDNKTEGQNRHPCWSLADDHDPACARCELFESCGQERIAQLPPCFGQDFDPNAMECKLCIEAIYCKSGGSHD